MERFIPCKDLYLIKIYTLKRFIPCKDLYPEKTNSKHDAILTFGLHEYALFYLLELIVYTKCRLIASGDD